MHLARIKWPPMVFKMETLFHITISLAKNLITFYYKKRMNSEQTPTLNDTKNLLVINICAFYRH